MKHIIFLLSLAVVSSVSAKTCPLMQGDEIDPDEVSTSSGKTIEFCCGSCVKAFDNNIAYYLKAIPSLGNMFTDAEKKKLKVCCVKLLPQRYCPIYPDRLINPNSPSVEYNSMKIYLWSSSAVRRWNRDPERYYKQAVESGVLTKTK
jgi:hypothetical protein